MTENSTVDSFFTDLGKALKVEEEKFQALLGAFRKLSLQEEAREEVEKLQPEEFGLTKEEFTAAFESGLSFYEANHEFAEAEERTAIVIRKVVEAMEETPDSSAVKDLEKRQLAIVEAFRPRERRVRIRSAFLHDERVYLSSIASPQLRPVFKYDSEAEIDTFVAVLNLQFEFLLGNQKQVTHMSMDLADLDDLIGSLELAKEQFEIMRESLSTKTWEVTSVL